MLQKGVLTAWVFGISIGTRYILTRPQDFGPAQDLEYTSIYIPLSLLLSWLVLVVFSNETPRLPRNWRYLLPTLSLFTVIVVRATYSQRPDLTIWWLAVVLTFALTALTIYGAIRKNPQLLRTFLRAILFVGALQAILALLQVSLGHTLGLSFFGEITATDTTLGVAKLVVDGTTLLRPIGTFLHANILGGFLALAFFGAIQLAKHVRFGLIERIMTSLVLLGLIASYSRAAWITGVLILGYGLVTIGPRAIAHKLALPLIISAIALIIWFPGVSARFNLSEHPQQINLRQQLQDQALETLAEGPAFGTGLRNYVVQLNQELLPHEKQPAHNALVHSAAELGFVGLALFTLLLLLVYWKLGIWRTIFGVLPFLPILLLDHYLITTTAGLGILATMFIVSATMCVPRETP